VYHCRDYVVDIFLNSYHNYSSDMHCVDGTLTVDRSVLSAVLICSVYRCSLLVSYLWSVLLKWKCWFGCY